MYLVNSISLSESFTYHKYSLVCWFSQLFIYIINLKLLVLYKSVHANTNHAQTLLNCFFKSSSYRHNLSNRFHTRTYLLRDTAKFTQIPTGNLYNYIIECRFEECGCCFGNRILKIKKPHTQTKLCCYKS